MGFIIGFLRRVFSLILTLSVFLVAGAVIYLGYQALTAEGRPSLLSMMTGDEETSEPEQDEVENIVSVRVAPLEITESFSVTRRFLGQIEAAQTAKLSFESGGYVTNILVKEGDLVNKGRILAVQDTTLLEVERDRLDATMAALEAELIYAEAQVGRFETLAERGVSGEDKRDLAVSTRDALTARVAEAKAGIRALTVQIRKASLVAPFEGYVAERLVDTGETVAAGQRVMTLTERGAARFRVGLPPHIETDTLETATVEIDGKFYDAVLDGVRPDLDARTRTRTMIFALEALEAYGIGRAGSIVAQDSFPGNGAWVPIEALREGTSNLWNILVVNPADRVQQAVVEIIHSESERAYVRGSFEADDRVIVAGGFKVTPGQLVKVTE